jgi:hypothetical protein
MVGAYNLWPGNRAVKRKLQGSLNFRFHSHLNRFGSVALHTCTSDCERVLRLPSPYFIGVTIGGVVAGVVSEPSIRECLDQSRSLACASASDCLASRLPNLSDIIPVDQLSTHLKSFGATPDLARDVH